MRGAAHDFAVGNAPTLMRLAHQLTGDRAAATEVVAATLARLESGRHLRGDRSVDELATHELLRSLPRRLPAPTTPSPLDRLTRRARIATVLAFGVGWDADGVADATRVTAHRARTEVATALAIAPQDQWERLLADASWSVPLPAGLLDEAARTARRRRDARRARRLGATALAVALAAATVAVVRVVTAPAPIPPIASDSQLLHWQARGDLVRDARLIDDATALWRDAPSGPSGPVFVLWAGHVGVGRLAVLQARDGHDRPAVAVVADHDVTFGHAELRLDLVSPLSTRNPAMLAIPYDGNLNVAGLQSGPGQQVVQLLARPDVTQVDERNSAAPIGVPSERPSFAARRLTAGLSDPWLDVRGDQPTTAVRAWSRDRIVFTGLLGDSVIPQPQRPVISDPPPAWAGLPRQTDPSLVADDALWWAQVCHNPAPIVSLIWAPPPQLPSRLRLEFVTCPGRMTDAEVLSDAPTLPGWVARQTLRPDTAGITLRVVPNRVRDATIVVVGSSAVHAIRVGPNDIAGRVAIVPEPGDVTVVAVFDGHGRQLPL